MLNTTKQPKPPTMDSEPFDVFLILLFCILSACTVYYYADTIDYWGSSADNCFESTGKN